MNNNYIFNPKEIVSEELLFCLSGKEDFIDDDGNPRLKDSSSNHLAAKCIKNKKAKTIGQDTKYTYYIRTTPNSEFYNPIEKLSPLKDKRQYNFIDSTCKNEWLFSEVSKVTFDKYLKFLSTKNVSWLKDANRDIK